VEGSQYIPVQMLIIQFPIPGAVTQRQKLFRTAETDGHKGYLFAVSTRNETLQITP
jgi:hypothetical protein